MRPRTLARRLAMQYLYIDDLNNGDCEAPLEFVRAHADRDEAVDYALALIDAALTEREEIDALVRQHAEHWDLERLAAVERSVLRLGAGELIQGKTPANVVISEAVKLAKKFAGADSPGFVNGVLDAIARSRRASAHSPVPAEETE
jgi:N utilization substance protein B